MHELMEQEGLKNYYISNGTTLLKYSPLQISDLTNTLVYVGRLEKYKGVDELLKAIPVILEKFPNTHLFIAGDGSDKSRLELIVSKFNLEKHVTFLGHIARPAIEDLYKRASVVVVPSVYPEAFGKVGIEAMSVGRPVVASNVGGISDWLIDGKTGFLVPPKDPVAISKAVIKIFSNPELFFQMMKQARKKAEEFDLNKHVDRMEKIYIDLVKSKLKKFSY
jgi:glycosyltransferase involved in cell wall biosynthesis